MTEEKLNLGYKMIDAIKILESSIEDFEKDKKNIIQPAVYNGRIVDMLIETNDKLKEGVITGMKNKLKSLKAEFAKL